jgi:aromatic ring-opening dioxygenase LigB subunit
MRRRASIVLQPGHAYAIERKGPEGYTEIARIYPDHILEIKNDGTVRAVPTNDETYSHRVPVPEIPRKLLEQIVERLELKNPMEGS